MDDHPLTPLLNQLQAAIVPPTQHASQLPSPSDLAFERTLSRKLNRSLDTEAERILTLASRILNWAAPSSSARQSDLDPDLIKDGVYNNVVTRIEHLLEHADDSIDRHLGVGKHRKNPNQGAVGAKSQEEMSERDKDRAKKDRLPARLLHAANLDKPQLSFTPRTTMPRPAVNDTSATGEGGIPLWKPLLRNKVNALASAEDGEANEGEGWLRTELYEPNSSMTLTTSTVPPPYTRYIHPYTDELAALKPSAAFLEKPETPKPHLKDSFDKTPFEWVDDEKALNKMVKEIRAAGESGSRDLAIDLEHHDFRTWGGITCLIQLSTRTKDYVIDALSPAVRDNLDALNEFFTDPSWVKVLHGANSDIVWLQRDFGLYIVGLFDTYHATRTLGYAQHSLASLLDMYTDFEPDKRYQLADWRIRPLSQEMLHYARSDTHYLLSIYDHLRLALHTKHFDPTPDSPLTPLEEVFAASTNVSRITFSLPPFDHETGHFDSGFLLPLAKHGQLKSYSTALAVPTLPIKTGWGPNEAKLEVLRAVVRWREVAAREEDESARFVLSIGGVWQLAELGGAGRIRDEREVMQHLGTARGGVSEVARKRKDDLARVIREAYEAATASASGEQGDGDVEMAPTRAEGAQQVQSLLAGAEEPSVRPALQSLWDADNTASTSAVAVQSRTGSDFFGSSAATAAATVVSPSVATASSSSFFGPSSNSTSSSSPSKPSAKAKGKLPASTPASTAASRAAAVSRVQRSLVLGGGLAQSLTPHSIPVPVPTSSAAAAAAVENSTMTTDSSEQPLVSAVADGDHTYIPFSGRVPKPESESLLPEGSRAPSYKKKEKDSDVIVVSSIKDKKGSAFTAPAPSAKKRKRPTTSSSTPLPLDATSLDFPSASTSTSASLEFPASPPPIPAKKPKVKRQTREERQALAASLTPHDYASQPSILDATPALASSKERRSLDKKEKKKDKRVEGISEAVKAAGKRGAKGLAEGVDTSDFQRAPRVQNSSKKWGKSFSFAS